MPKSGIIYSKTGARERHATNLNNNARLEHKGAHILSKSIKWTKTNAKWNPKRRQKQSRIEKRIQEASSVLGAAPWNRFWKPLRHIFSSRSSQRWHPQSDPTTDADFFYDPKRNENTHFGSPFSLWKQWKTMRKSIPGKWWEVMQNPWENEVTFWYIWNNLSRTNAIYKKSACTETTWILQ